MRINRLQKLFIILVSILIVGFAIWLSFISPMVGMIPSDFYTTTVHVGEDQYRSDLQGNLSDKFNLVETYTEEVIGGGGDILNIKSSIVGKNELTDEVVFATENVHPINRKTKKHQGYSNQY